MGQLTGRRSIDPQTGADLIHLMYDAYKTIKDGPDKKVIGFDTPMRNHYIITKCAVANGETGHRLASRFEYGRAQR